MGSASEIRNGLCINHNHDVYSVVEFLHVKPGKGPAFVRIKLKSLTNGKVIDQTIPSSHKIDIVRVERKQYQFLYNDDAGYHFMDNETFEQAVIPEELIDYPGLLLEGSNVEILFHADKNVPLTLDMPQYVVMEIKYTEPGVKGDTATNATKPAKLETGAEVRVPLFIKEGDNIKIDTKTGSYVERVNK